MSANAEITSTLRVNEDVISAVMFITPLVACITWLVIVSCSCPSRSRDCRSQEARVNEWNSRVRNPACTSAAIRAGRIESGNCSSRRTVANTNAIAISVPADASR